MYKSPTIYGLHLRKYGNHIRDLDSIGTAMAKESEKLIARSRSIIKPFSEEDCDSIQLFLHKYPFVRYLMRNTGVIPLHLADLLTCGGRPINTHNRNSLLFGESVCILKAALLCSGAQKACRMTACQEKTMDCLTNAVVSLYLSQKFHDALKWQPDAAVINASYLQNNATALPTGPNLNLLSQERLEGKQDKVVVLIGDLFITETYSWLAKMPSHNNVVQIISENLATFSQNIFMNSQHPERGAMKKEQILSEKAIRSLFASTFLSAGILAQAESQVGDRLQNFGNEIGGLYYEYISTLYFLKSKHVNAWSESNSHFREQWKARIAVLEKRRGDVALMAADQNLTPFCEDLMDFLTYRRAS